MLDLKNDLLEFSFPEVHPDAKVTIELQRTLRIPDDGRSYPLPPGLGKFPIRKVDDYSHRVPERWMKHGGVMVPMYQSEALWIKFNGNHSYNHGTQYPFAVRVAAGKRSAVTGDSFVQNLKPEDYVVVPKQPWLNGFKVDGGKIRQFVAMPLGMGLTVEAQLDGTEEHGGLQIQVFPMKREAFERRFAKIDHSLFSGRRLMRSKCMGPVGAMPMSYSCSSQGMAPAADMGLGAGGLMTQEIFSDSYGFDEWDTGNTSRCFIHLANSLAWRAITSQEPPRTPVTSAAYNQAGYPWYDHYREDWRHLEGTPALRNIQSVLALGFQKGLGGVIPENESFDIERSQVRDVTPRRHDAVRDGLY